MKETLILASNYNTRKVENFVEDISVFYSVLKTTTLQET